jgi:4-amino-4-deoxy-L-arabinose transferase-like glycosyltransferase
MLRLIGLGFFPSGNALNPDEAFAGYEAWSLLHYGIDSHGYTWPVYLVAWGSGMNALETYLMIPFVGIWGLTPLAIRLPQAIIGVLSLAAFYGLLKTQVSEERALAGMGLLAVLPWHIMLSRFGLESNLLPGFLLMGMYFLGKGLQKPKYYMLSGLFFGLSLYCYATVWPVMPILVLGFAIAILIYQKGKVTKWFWLGLLVIVILAIPLILFCLVNYGYIPELKLGVLSIPKLAARRSVEIKTHTWEWKRNFLDAVSMFIKQDDGNPWNATSKFGLYYPGWICFAVLGLIVMVIRIVRNWREHLVDVLILIQGFAACVLASLISVNFNRVNMIHIPIIYCMIRGLCFVMHDIWAVILNNKNKQGAEIGEERLAHKDIWRNRVTIGLSGFATAFYIANLVLFLLFYTGPYNQQWRWMYHAGLDEAVAFANEKAGEQGTCFVTDVLYPKLLFSAKYPTDHFADTVVYRDDTAEFLDPESFAGFHMGDFMNGLQKSGDVMICGTWNEATTEYLNSLGYEQHVFEDYTVYIVQ